MALAHSQVLRRDSRWLIGFGVAAGAVLGAGVALHPATMIVSAGLSVLLLVTVVALIHPEYLTLEIPVVLLFATTVSFRIRTAEQLAENPLDAQGLFRLMCVMLALGLAVFAWLFSERRVIEGKLTTLPVRLYFLYAAVAVAGITMSVLPLLTAYRVVELLTVLIVVAAAYRSRGAEALRKMESMIYWFSVALVGLVWVGFILFPSQAMTPMNSPIPFRLNGVYPWTSANEFGTLGVLLSLWSIAKILTPDSEKPRPSVLYAMTGLGFLSLIFAQYRTGYVALLVGITILLVVRRRKMLATLILAGTASIFVLIPGLFSSTLPYLLRGADVERASRLSGRVIWWKLGIETWKQKPWIGGGLQTASRFEVFAANKLDVSNIHSAWIEALVGTGIIGITLLAAAVLVAWRRAIVDGLRAGGRLAPLMILVILTVRSLTGVGFEQGGKTSLLFMTLALGMRDHLFVRKAQAP